MCGEAAGANGTMDTGNQPVRLSASGPITGRGQAMVNAGRKGQRWERAVPQHLAAAGLAILQRRSQGQSGDDLTVRLPGGRLQSVEAKNQRSLQLAAWLDQAHSQDRADGATPLLIVRRKGRASPGEAYAVLAVDDLIALLLPHTLPHGDSIY